jgi:hypothetical protein
LTTSDEECGITDIVGLLGETRDMWRYIEIFIGSSELISEFSYIYSCIE